jgi:CO dehydrogenase/acetyl-CoA synthase beta subunit
MKADVFKKLIKEAVREAVREELSEMLTTPQQPKQVQEITKYQNYKPVIAKPVSTGDPIMDLLQETRASMTSGDYKTMVSMDSSMAQNGMPVMGSMLSGPEPGIDISQLSFVKNAGKVFQASVEKDKQRFGA